MAAARVLKHITRGGNKPNMQQTLVHSQASLTQGLTLLAPSTAKLLTTQER